MKAMTCSPRAFTIIELLAVVALLGVLVALLLPTFRNAIARSQQSACLANLRQIGAAAVLYAGEHDGWLPGIRFTAAEGETPENRFPGQQWDVQLMPYLDIPDSTTPSSRRTVFYCPASQRNPAFAMNRQLSYAWNSRLTPAEPYQSRRLANLERASSILMAVDNQITPENPVNQATFQAAGNTIYVNDTVSQLRRVAYARHGGHANVLFADGSASPRLPVSTSNPAPQRVRFYNNGPLSAGGG